MSISTTENRDSVRALDTMAAEQERQQRAEISMIEDFLAACQRCDANSLASFAPLIPDWQSIKNKGRIFGDPVPKRVPTLAEVLEESLDYPSGPSKTELFQLVLNLAFSTQDQDVLAQQARQLLASAANIFAVHNAGVEA